MEVANMVMEAAPRPHLLFGGDVREEKSRQLAAELRQTVLRNLGRAVDPESSRRSIRPGRKNS